MYQFVLRDRRKSARTDLWQAIGQVCGEFSDLFDGVGDAQAFFVPDEPFPFEQSRHARSRVVTAVEVREAIRLLMRHRSSGWTRTSLFNALFRWAGLDAGPDVPLSLVDPPSAAPQPDVRLLAHGLAERVRSTLAAEEMSILREFIIPNELQGRTLAEAATVLQMPRSTLHDGARKIRAKLIDEENADFMTTHPAFAAEFVRQILELSAGNEPGEPPITPIEGSDD
jgi:hypothetical protein